MTLDSKSVVTLPSGGEPSRGGRLCRLPNECIETILEYLAPHARFRLVTEFRFLYIQRRVLPLLHHATMNHASRRGQTDLLEYWKRSGLPLSFSIRHALDDASAHGHIHVLAWWKENSHLVSLSRCELDSFSEFDTTHAIEAASNNGHTDVLNWWLNDSGVAFKYTRWAIDRAENVCVLNWWKQSGLEFKYTTTAIDYASRHERINVLEWWLQQQHELELQYSSVAMVHASRHGHIAVLDWWRNSGLELKYTLDVLLYVDDMVLEWWKQSGLLFEFGSTVLSIVAIKKDACIAMDSDTIDSHF